MALYQSITLTGVIKLKTIHLLLLYSGKTLIVTNGANGDVKWWCLR